MDVLSTNARLVRKYNISAIHLGTDVRHSYAWPAHGPDGKVLIDRVWDETLEELKHFSARGIIESFMRK